MNNRDIAAVFTEMADLLAIKGSDEHRSRAFARMASVIEKLPDPIASLRSQNRLSSVPGIGDGGIARIKQILRTGTCSDHQRLLAELPRGLRDMLDIKGMGPRAIRVIYSHLRIASVDELENAARAGKLAGLPRLGEGSQERILRGIEAYRERIGRQPLYIAMARAEPIAAAMREIPGAVRVELAGSARRRKDTMRDLDILVAAEDGALFTSCLLDLPEIREVYSSGRNHASVRLDTGEQVDLRVYSPEHWGTALHYFTGSKDHNIAVRTRSLRYGFRISDKGLFERDGDTLLKACATEAELFASVGLAYIPPELREHVGEIDAAEAGTLPRLIEPGELLGDLHMHTTFSDGAGTLPQMLQAAADEGYSYVAITDHSYMIRSKLADVLAAIGAADDERDDIRVLAGVEVDIEADGSLQLDPEVLATFDWVVASVHGAHGMPAEAMTPRLARAIESGVVDAIGHPTGRRLSSRPASAFDAETVFRAAREHGVALEINGQPERMDLDAVNARLAKELGAKLVVSSDAHSVAEVSENRRFGIYAARRGWIEASDVLNTQAWEGIEERRHRRLRDAGFTVRARKPRSIKRSPTAPAARGGDETDGASTATAPSTPPSDSAGPPDPALVEALRVAQHGGEVSEALVQRLEAYLTAPDDANLHEALAHLSDNPVQIAFDLLVTARGNGGTSSSSSG